jgi:hypothetical protein
VIKDIVPDQIDSTAKHPDANSLVADSIANFIADSIANFDL